MYHAKQCDCHTLMRCDDCGRDVSAYVRMPRTGITMIEHHKAAGHKMTPYGCEDCQPSLRQVWPLHNAVA